MSNFLTLCLVVTLFGSSTFFRKFAVDGMSPYHLQAIAGIIYASLIPLWLRMGPSVSSGGPSLKAALYGACAILCNVVGSVIFGFLLRKSSPAMLSTAASTAPVVTFALSCVFLGETFTIRKALGIALVLVGMALFQP